jgi:hypothetical protein
VKIAEAGKVAARAVETGIAGAARIGGAKIPAIVAAVTEIRLSIWAIRAPLHLLGRCLRRRGLGLWRGLQAMPAALLGALALVGLMALNLVREVGGAATWRRGLCLGLRCAWPSRVGTGAATAGTAMLRTALAGAAITMTMTMFIPGLRESGCGGQGQNSDRYQQAAHLILRENTARLITGLYRFGFPLAPLWSMNA